MSRAERYLRVPPEYARALGGLNWALGCEAIDDAFGRTFVFAGEVGRFLEGFAGQRSLVHFGHVLHLLYLLHWPPRSLGQDSPLHRLHQAYRRQASIRNAGLF